MSILTFSLFAVSVNADGNWETNLENLTPAENQPAKFENVDSGLKVSRGTAWDALAISDTKPTGDFAFESDVTFEEGNVANIIFGAQHRNDSQESLVFKFDRNNRGETKVFSFSDSRGFPLIAANNGIDFGSGKDSYRLKVVVSGKTVFCYVDGVRVCGSVLPDWYQDGYLGIGTAEGASVIFQNTKWSAVNAESANWDNNLGTLNQSEEKPAASYVFAEGIIITKSTENDGIMISDTKPEGDFYFETEVTFAGGSVANLVVGAADSNKVMESFVFKFDKNNYNETKIFCFSEQRGWATLLTCAENGFEKGKDSYKLRVEVKEGKFIIYVDGNSVAQAELPEFYEDGYIGIGAAEGSAIVFQNTKHGSFDQPVVDQPVETPTTGDSAVLLTVAAAVLSLGTVIGLCTRRKKTEN